MTIEESRIENPNPSRRWFIAALVLLFVACGALAFFYREYLTIEALEAFVLRLGIWAPIAYVVIYALATVAMVPGGVFDALGGAIFGPVLGTAVNLAGASIGAMLAFGIARYVAGDWAERKGGPRVREIKKSVEAEGWRFVAMVRLVPIFPYTIFNYLLGLTRIPFWQYAVLSVVCMSPITVAYTWMGYVGRNLAAGGGEDQIRNGLVLLALLSIAAFLPPMIKRWRAARAPATATAAQTPPKTP